MPADITWPGQQLGDLATYSAVSYLITGGNPAPISFLSPKRYGRWASVVRQLFDAYAHGGHSAVFQSYLRAVYSNPEFALLMATLGMQTPDREWQNDELPNRTNPPLTSLVAPPAPPAKKPASRLPRSYSIFDLPSGRYNSSPPKRHAVREEEVHLALRTLGEATGAELARHTGQNRSNVHRRINKLVEKGLAQRHVTPNGVVYRAAPAEG